MDRMPRVRVVYRVESIDEPEPPVEWPDDVTAVEVPVMMAAYLHERRRAIITELRRIEELLRLPSSLPRRERPHWQRGINCCRIAAVVSYRKAPWPRHRARRERFSSRPVFCVPRLYVHTQTTQ